MAKTQAHHARNNMPTLSLVFFVSVAIISLVAALAKVDAQGPPSKIEIYNDLPGSAVVSASPSGNATGFGTIAVVNVFVRAGPEEDSAPLGQVVSQVIFAMDGSRFLITTHMLNITGYAGTISAQGVVNPVGGGQVPIVGGTGDFLSVKGSVEGIVIIPNVLNKHILYIDYP